MNFPNPGFQPQAPQGYPQQGYPQAQPGYGAPQPGYGQPQQPPAPQPATQTVDEFFANNAGGSGVPSFKFVNVGDQVLGTIVAMQPRQKTDPATGALKFNKDGITPQIQLEITLQTELTGWAGVDPTKIPTDPQTGQQKADDGKRRIFAFFHMRDALMAALAAAGVQKPEIGDKLAMQFSGIEPAARPGLSDSKLYQAWFQKGAGPAADAYFQGQQQPQSTPQQAPAQQAPQPAPQPGYVPTQGAPNPSYPAQQAPQQAPAPQYQQPPAPGQYPSDPPF